MNISKLRTDFQNNGAILISDFFKSINQEQINLIISSLSYSKYNPPNLKNSHLQLADDCPQLQKLKLIFVTKELMNFCAHFYDDILNNQFAFITKMTVSGKDFLEKHQDVTDNKEEKSKKIAFSISLNTEFPTGSVTNIYDALSSNIITSITHNNFGDISLLNLNKKFSHEVTPPTSRDRINLSGWFY